MFCPNCGAQLVHDARFCLNCGAAIPTVEQESAPSDVRNFNMETQTPAQTAVNAEPQIINENPAVAEEYAPAYQIPEMPYSHDPTDPPAQKKSKKKLWFIIGGAVVLVAVIALVLVLLLGGENKTPTGVVETYLEATFNGEQVKMLKCKGIDYKKYMLISYEEVYDYDIDELVNDWFEEQYWFDDDSRLGWYCNEYDLDYDKWENRLDKVSNFEDYIEFEIDFYAACRKADNEEHGRSYEIKNIEEEELTGSDRREAEDQYEDWYGAFEGDFEDAVLFDEDDIDGYYLVTGKLRYEEDGDTDTERFSVLVVQTSEGCFIIDTDWEP